VLLNRILHKIQDYFNNGGRKMNQTNQVNTMETRTRNNEVIFFKSQEEFAKALREGIGSAEENGLVVELTEK